MSATWWVVAELVGVPVGSTFPDWLAASGDAGAGLGASVTSGDVDGDGFLDVVAGAPEGSDGGAVLWYRGSPAGPSAVPDGSIVAVAPDSWLGAAVDATGDVDGDGIADLLVGAPFEAASDGAVWWLRGSPAGLPPGPDAVLGQASSGSALGSSVATGDLDGDGYDDALVGAFTSAVWMDYLAGAFAFLGSPEGPAADADWSAELAGGDGYRDALTVTVAAGDLDGDGYGDALLGETTINGEGSVAVYRGSSTGPAAASDWRTDSNGTDSRFGASIAAGDVDRDGFDDLAVGAPALDGDGGVLVYLGSPAGPSALADVTIMSLEPEAELGTAVAFGDVNGDGCADLLGVAPAWGPADEGAVLVYLGAPSGLATDPARTDVSGDAWARLAAAVAGDVDSDGLDEVIGGAAAWGDAARDEGAVLAFRGFATDGDGDGHPTPGDCDDHDAGVHPGAIEACGDGIDQDCDGADTAAGTFHADADRDGFGDRSTRVEACEAPDGSVEDGTDCDDTSAAAHPGAKEACNGVDDDCDGDVDPGCDPSAATDPAHDLGGAAAAPDGCGCALGARPVGGPLAIVTAAALATLGRNRRSRFARALVAKSEVSGACEAGGRPVRRQ